MTGKYDDLKREDLERIDVLLRQAEEICRYWHWVGSERALVRIRSRLARSRSRLASGAA